MAHMDDALWACDLSNWYRHPVLSKCTFPTRFVELPQGFVERLLKSEGLFARADEEAEPEEWSDSEWKDEGYGDDGELEQRKERQQETWPELEKEIGAALKRWCENGASGGVFPRLNWSSPIDAHWLGIGGSLRCTTVAEVLRFLEASDQVRGDLELLHSLAQRNTDSQRQWKPTLALRKWHDFHTPSEFRCFVRNNRLIAICQKDITNFWPFLVEMRTQNLQSLTKFFEEKIKGALTIDSYVFDAYIHSQGSCHLVDISPFDPEHIEPILWSWEELKAIDDNIPTPYFKIIEEATNIMPNLRKMATAVPFDLINTEEHPDQDELGAVDPNDMEALVERLKKITEAAEKLNQAEN